MHMVGTLEMNEAGYKYIVVIVDYAICYPEAIPFHTMMAKVVATGLMKVISLVSVPHKIITDQGTNFMSQSIKAAI